MRRVKEGDEEYQVLRIHHETDAERMRNVRARQGEAYRSKDRTRKRAKRASSLPEFIAVDSEGIGRGKNHRAVLVGVGEMQYVARDLRKGLQWAETFEFLYSCYEQNPSAAYVGFYLSYDFNQWLRSLPEVKAWYLLSPQGQASRKCPEMKTRRTHYPVRIEGWEIDMLGFKRLSIRPRVCQCVERRVKCIHPQKGWMSICDAGTFFAMSFASITKPDMWADDPDGPICTNAEWNKLFAGKERRATAKLDKKMMEYNVLENMLLARCMDRLARGFLAMGIRLSKDQWYGPGASASKWLSNHKAVKQHELKNLTPDWFLDACQKSYFGGWFEIFSHGIIKGESYNYDINNAYPFATSKLPHICGDCGYKRGRGQYKGDGKYVLLSATVHSKGTRIGAVPYRDSKGSILRPGTSRGWYWASEIEAGIRAGLVTTSKTEYHEWVEFIPCDHPAPYTEVEELYERRLSVGKNSAQGLSIKLNNNSLYGKFAQNKGAAPFNNWFYASYITSHCRTQILEAIASHPGKSDSVLMVATDGICFDSPHPSLPVSKKLGEWDATTYIDLCLFKPGVYWHKQGKEALLKIKSRGVPKKEFATGIEKVEAAFQIMLDTKSAPGDPVNESALFDSDQQMWAELHTNRGWPWFTVPVSFRMKSCKAALNEQDWSRAAMVQEQVFIDQNSDPQSKRTNAHYNSKKRRIDSDIHHLSPADFETKYYGEISYPPLNDDFAFDESPTTTVFSGVGAVLTKTRSPYELPDNMEWEMIWDQGREI
jgi:DNA polymerase type B, organellar and viral